MASPSVVINGWPLFQDLAPQRWRGGSTTSMEIDLIFKTTFLLGFRRIFRGYVKLQECTRWKSPWRSLILGTSCFTSSNYLAVNQSGRSKCLWLYMEVQYVLRFSKFTPSSVFLLKIKEGWPKQHCRIHYCWWQLRIPVMDHQVGMYLKFIKQITTHSLVISLDFWSMSS